ncbi:putative flippase GtrA [Luteibacter rhizovicinus]|uniref:Putative flippase GtrA n=1 Tax=Luteibacter rhizovicinus TaxID=242606 RepID=A0A4R3YZU3_9GAMM|nr:GtrA family protein [Luteibacter rhizovicinus]TCV97448.1 putative flippase GtrA [Luteibacter rhizovicinus]
MRLGREIVLFAVGGVIGFVVDAGIAQSLVGLAHWNVYAARVVSFLSAATVTWWWNSRHTFKGRDSGISPRAEWLHWMGLMAVGALFNNGAYVAVLELIPSLKPWPAVAVAVGSLAGAVANYGLARTLLFRNAKTVA